MGATLTLIYPQISAAAENSAKQHIYLGRRATFITQRQQPQLVVLTLNANGQSKTPIQCSIHIVYMPHTLSTSSHHQWIHRHMFNAKPTARQRHWHLLLMLSAEIWQSPMAYTRALCWFYVWNTRSHTGCVGHVWAIIVNATKNTPKAERDQIIEIRTLWS